MGAEPILFGPGFAVLLDRLTWFTIFLQGLVTLAIFEGCVRRKRAALTQATITERIEPELN